MTTEIHVASGLSGCKLQVVQEGNSVYMRKSTKDVEYRLRLKEQAAKQQHFYETNRLSSILIPRIIGEHEESGRYSFDMPFFRSMDSLTFFQEATKSEVDVIAKHLIEFIEYNIEESFETEVPRERILEKLREVQERTASNPTIDQARKEDIWNETALIFSRLPKTIKIPVGHCHGDLTFSNILINRNDKKLVLIDWLDTFIETPLQDIVKLRQDTQYAWSLYVSKKSFDKTKILLIMAYLDKKIDDHFRQYPFYRSYYLLFQTLNFLRILPYIKEHSLLLYVQATIRSIIRNNGI